MAWLFLFFLVSGFCSILYELIWLRLAMANFGVTTPMVSTALSMFMTGLGLGSWLSGSLSRRFHGKFHALRIYALLELLIGLSALVVPLELSLGHKVLRNLDTTSSSWYYLFSGVCVAVSLIPWSVCIGATIPLGMQVIRSGDQLEAPRSFSYLYLANVLGATAGTTIPLLLIEMFGFHGTLAIGAALNGLLAAVASLLSLRSPAVRTVFPELRQESRTPTKSPKGLLVLLFGSGLCSMALEVVWIRQFTPYLGTVVYAFAAILGFYLLMTFLGSAWYRRSAEQPGNNMAWGVLGLAIMFPLFTTDPSWDISAVLRLVLGIGPFTLLLGFLTPMLIDRWSGGDPDRAGTAYAVNVVGCIVGPLLAGFILLPLMNERWVTLVFALPWFMVGTFQVISGTGQSASLLGRVALAAVALLICMLSRSFEDKFPFRQVRRDHTATIIATGTGMDKRLMVNGIGITILTPITKMMAHLPLAFLDHPPQSGLIICFGMGTSYRSMLSWNISTTAVDLVPSVFKMFPYYHADALELLRSPLSRTVGDDGRRYLERITDRYDVITIDPPPPVQAAGSSLLYSTQFYETAKLHLREGGILQQWLPYGDPVLYASVTRALTESFQYVRVFGSVEGWGFHFLCSSHPIPDRSAAELAERMPTNARKDLVEWGPQTTAQAQFGVVLKRETKFEQLLDGAPFAPALRDNRPVNEYFLLRRFLRPYRWRKWVWEDRQVVGDSKTGAHQP
jgi:spermidine synthase